MPCWRPWYPWPAQTTSKPAPSMIVGTEAETDLQDRDGPPTRRPHRSRPMQLRPSQPTRRRTSQPTRPHQVSSWSSTRRRRAALPRRQQEAVHRGRRRSASRSKTPPRPSQLHTSRGPACTVRTPPTTGTTAGRPSRNCGHSTSRVTWSQNQHTLLACA